MSFEFKTCFNRYNPCMSSIMLVFLTIYLMLEFLGVMVLTGTVATEGSTVVREYNKAFHKALGYEPPKDAEQTEPQPRQKHDLNKCLNDIVNHYKIISGPESDLRNISMPEKSEEPENKKPEKSQENDPEQVPESEDSEQPKKFKDVKMYIFNGINFFVVSSFWFCIFRTFDKSWCTYFLVVSAFIYVLILLFSGVFKEEQRAHNKILDLVNLQNKSIKYLWLIPLTALWVMTSKKMEIPRTKPPQKQPNPKNKSKCCLGIKSNCCPKK